MGLEPLRPLYEWIVGLPHQAWRGLWQAWWGLWQALAEVADRLADAAMDPLLLRWAWTDVALVGLLVTLWLVIDAWADLRAVERAIERFPRVYRRWGPRWWLALRDLGAHGGFGYVWCVFFAIGAAVLRFAPIPPKDTPQEALAVFFAWGLLSAELVMAGVQVWIRLVNGKVRHARTAAIG
jgi:hypothetical protein